MLPLLLFFFSRLLTFPPLFATFGFAAPTVHAALVTLVLWSGPLSLFVRPIAAFWSRKQEYDADRFTSKLGYREPLGKALIKLAADNLSNPVPHPLYTFYYASHPGLLERLRALGLR